MSLNRCHELSPVEFQRHVPRHIAKDMFANVSRKKFVAFQRLLSAHRKTKSHGRNARMSAAAAGISRFR